LSMSMARLRIRNCNLYWISFVPSYTP
jgi:hypothetical protein